MHVITGIHFFYLCVNHVLYHTCHFVWVTFPSINRLPVRAHNRDHENLPKISLCFMAVTEKKKPNQKPLAQEEILAMKNPKPNTDKIHGLSRCISQGSAPFNLVFTEHRINTRKTHRQHLLATYCNRNSSGTSLAFASRTDITFDAFKKEISPSSQTGKALQARGFKHRKGSYTCPFFQAAEARGNTEYSHMQRRNGRWLVMVASLMMSRINWYRRVECWKEVRRIWKNKRGSRVWVSPTTL